MAEDSVALWYWRHHSLRYSLHDSEEEAASAAVFMEDDGRASVAGVQFADGRILRSTSEKWESARDWWPAYRTHEDKQWEEARTYVPPPPVPTREVRDPFGFGKTVTIAADEPAWLGQTVEDG